MITPQQAAANWARGMSGAGEKIKQGVQNVTENPAQKAIAAIPRQVQGVMRAAESGKTARGLGRVTLEGWKQAMIDKGAGRVSGGAQAALPKFQAFMDEFLPFVQTAVQQLNSSNPRGDLEANIARSGEMQRKIAQFRRRA